MAPSPSIPSFFSPPSPLGQFPLTPLPPTPWRPPTPDNSSSKGGVIAGILVALVAAMVVYVVVTNICKGARNSRARAVAAARPRPPPEPPTRPGDERQLGGASAASPTAGLPAFAYSRSVRYNVMGGGEEATTCSVCLGVFQLGETVRLLPVCLHLYHVECIDPWLDAHSTCPLCRSDIDPAMDVAWLPPV